MYDINVLIDRTEAVGYSYKDTRETLEDLRAARREMTALKSENVQLEAELQRTKAGRQR